MTLQGLRHRVIYRKQIIVMHCHDSAGVHATVLFLANKPL